MIYQVRLAKGLFSSEKTRYQLHNSEAVMQVKGKIILLYIASILIFGLYGFLGIGSESFSKELLKLSVHEFETGKMFVLAGDLISGIIYPSVYLFLIALFLWTVTDIEYVKLLIVQMIVFTLQLLEKVVMLPFFTFLHLNQDANPFSLGVISQYFIANEYIIHLFSEVTLFQVLVIAIQYYYLKSFTEKSKHRILLMIIVSYLIVWLMNALLAYLKVSVFM